MRNSKEVARRVPSGSCLSPTGNPTDYEDPTAACAARFQKEQHTS